MKSFKLEKQEETNEEIVEGEKTKTVAILLALFLGGLGAHKFYLKQNVIGILYVLFFWTYIPALLSILEAIVYATMSRKDFNKKYNS
jgi:TM2 domain-containing membrane protein YozV